MRKNKCFKEIIAIIILLPIIATPFLINTNSGLIKYLQKLSGSNCPYLDLELFHGDENHWLINSHKYFKLLFIYKNVSSKQWGKFSAYDQPPVGKYVMGLALFIAGDKDEIQELEQMNSWDFSKDYDWNVANGAIPPMKLLHAARLTMAILGIFTCLLIYYIGRSIFGLKTGIIASLLLAYNPLMVSCSRRAMPDALFLFFVTANIALIMFFYRSFLKQELQKTVVFAALIGINIALASATKLNGAITGVIFVFFCILILFTKTIQYKSLKTTFKSKLLKLKSDKELKILTGSLLISMLVAIIVFIAVNPYLYKQTLGRTINLVEHRASMANGQQKDNPDEALTYLSEKFNSVVRRTMFPGSYVILSSILKIPIDLALFILGLIILLYTEIKHIRNNCKPSLRSIVILWAIITFLSITVWLPLDWDRYYLPIVLCVVMISGYIIDKIISKLVVIVKIIVNKRKTFAEV